MCNKPRDCLCTVQVQVDPCPAPWSASSTYVQGDIVSYNGVKYQPNGGRKMNTQM
ncbi:carbohydrate-binding protein [Paenibacillus alvei]|uniref:carbohydrate-binding protein n=1 Tax=Paenibacillus alvei TaxID=44250 RepID=UPI003AF302A7